MIKRSEHVNVLSLQLAMKILHLTRFMSMVLERWSVRIESLLDRLNKVFPKFQVVRLLDSQQ